MVNATKLGKGLKKAQQKKMLAEINAKQEAQAEGMEKARQEAEFLRPIVKEKFWPLVKDKKIEEVDILCQIFTGRMGEYFSRLQNTMKVSDLHLEEVFTEGDEMKMLEIVKDLTYNQANKIIGGMSGAISSCIRREQKERNITELKELVSEFE